MCVKLLFGTQKTYLCKWNGGCFAAKVFSCNSDYRCNSGCHDWYNPCVQIEGGSGPA